EYISRAPDMNLCVRSKYAKKVRFDERFIWAWETDFGYRLTRLGKMKYVPDAIVYHKVPIERMNVRYLRHWRFNKGRSSFQESCAGRRHLPQPWLLKECILSGMSAINNRFLGKEESWIENELQFWTQLGQIAGGLCPKKQVPR
ncbi:MAG: hypothetical protein NC930_05375, partial [Candidatus Omnitrophica bacterium]|nr:hypothetical protein [Candidatus Omnitrophota bacterium]